MQKSGYVRMGRAYLKMWSNQVDWITWLVSCRLNNAKPLPSRMNQALLLIPWCQQCSVFAFHVHKCLCAVTPLRWNLVRNTAASFITMRNWWDTIPSTLHKIIWKNHGIEKVTAEARWTKGGQSDNPSNSRWMPTFTTSPPEVQSACDVKPEHLKICFVSCLGRHKRA